MISSQSLGKEPCVGDVKYAGYGDAVYVDFTGRILCYDDNFAEYIRAWNFNSAKCGNKAGKILSEILKRKKNAHHKKQKEIYSKTSTRKGALVKKKRIKSKQKVVQAKKA